MFSSSSSSSSIAPSKLDVGLAVDPFPIRSAVKAAIGPNSQNRLLISDLVKLVLDYLPFEGAFDSEEWEKFCGKVDPAPALPDNIENIWLSQCPVDPEKRVCDNHMLVYIPKTVNGKPLTLKSLGEIAKQYFPKTGAGYRFIWDDIVSELGDNSIEKSCWVLMTKNVLPDSKRKSFAVQQGLVVELAKKVQTAAYEVPRTLEAAVCILAQYFRSHDSTKTRLFSDDPWTYTRCQEEVRGYRVIVGGFAVAGLDVDGIHFDFGFIGVAALRKF